MNSLYDFIVEPIGDKYNNKIKVGDKDLVVNSKVESFKFVNRQAIVIAIPLAFETNIRIGDTIIIHQNVFRTFYDSRGKKKRVDLFLKKTFTFVL